MTDFDTSIAQASGKNFVYGDHISVIRDVEGLTAAQTISKGWLTVKVSVGDTDADAVLQLEITTTETDDGQITNDGAAATEGEVTFTISGSDYDDIEAETTYVYDVQVLLGDGTITTLEVGKVRWSAGVTQKTE